MLNAIVCDPKYAAMFQNSNHVPNLNELETFHFLDAQHRAERRARAHAFLTFLFARVYASYKTSR